MSDQLTRADCIAEAASCLRIAKIESDPSSYYWLQRAQAYATLATVPLCQPNREAPGFCILFEGHAGSCEGAESDDD